VKGPRVLVVDDEPQLLRALRTTLEGSGYTVDTAENGEAALAAVSIRAPDVILLDLVLPDMRGTDVCREVRLWSAVPIVLVSAVDDEAEKIAALDAGADDYVTKPFAIGELLARLRAVLRRTVTDGEPVIEVGALRIDLEKHLVTVDGRSVHLTPHEFDVLALLARNKGKLLTQRVILTEVWGTAYQQESSYLHVYVSQLRRKLEPDPARPRYLLTETGVGYRLVEPDAESAPASLDHA
jgi:two-component system KDP operon response regulator KdpE